MSSNIHSNILNYPPVYYIPSVHLLLLAPKKIWPSSLREEGIGMFGNGRSIGEPPPADTVRMVATPVAAAAVAAHACTCTLSLPSLANNIVLLLLLSLSTKKWLGNAI